MPQGSPIVMAMAGLLPEVMAFSFSPGLGHR
jgi:hypothetical protein